MHDVVICGGTILDDDHTDAFASYVTIDGNCIAQVGGKAGRARATSTRTPLSHPGRVDVYPLRRSGELGPSPLARPPGMA
jgi:hypothetical protein